MQPTEQLQNMDKLDKLIRDLIYEMKDQRNDGWVNDYFRKRLEQLKKQIDKALE